MMKKTQSTIQLPKHWSLLLTILMPLLLPTTVPTTTTTIMTTPQSTGRLSRWSALLVSYRRGDEVIYNGMRYRCLTPHQSYAGAEPGLLTWALWKKV